MLFRAKVGTGTALTIIMRGLVDHFNNIKMTVDNILLCYQQFDDQ